MNFPKINILLSTFNGEKYLHQQLDSIFNQTYQNFILCIRDDGSTDSTPSLLKNYINEHPSYQDRIIFLAAHPQQNIGYMNSFWELLKNCPPADYYAFCDQDDVWLPTKLEDGIAFLQKENYRLPLLYFSSFYMCNEDLSVRHAIDVNYPSLKLADVLFYTPAYGFSIIINEPLRTLALKTSNTHNLPHDGWLQKLAAAFGKIIYNPNYTAYYRRHNLAVTSSNKNIFSLLKNWFINDIFGSSMKETHYVLSRFYEEYGKNLNNEDADLITTFATSENTIHLWFKRLIYPKKFRPSLGGRIALRICFFLNTY